MPRQTCRQINIVDLNYNISVMSIGYNNGVAGYTMDGTELTRIEEEKDLGVIICDNLKPSRQCVEAVKKANRMLGMIRRNFVDKHQETVIRLYKVLVRPHLEYAVQAWNPYLRKYVDLIEGEQRSATKMVEGLRNMRNE